MPGRLRPLWLNVGGLRLCFCQLVTGLLQCADCCIHCSNGRLHSIAALAVLYAFRQVIKGVLFLIGHRLHVILQFSELL